MQRASESRRAALETQWSLSRSWLGSLPRRTSKCKRAAQPHRSPTSPLNTAAPHASLHHRVAEQYTHKMSGHVDSLSPSFAPFFGMVSASRDTDDFIS
jgi:hypothetical protein